MKKIIYYNAYKPGYKVYTKYVSEKNGLLGLLVIAFSKTYDDWVSADISGEILYLWDEYAREDFDSWDEMPKLKMFNDDYFKIAKAWNEAAKNEIPFLVLIQDDRGRVFLESKQELSKEDLRFAKEENQIYEDLKKQGKIWI